MSRNRHITAPAGFLAGGVACGIKESGLNDLAIVACQKDATAAIVTTSNQIIGAPITWCRQILPRGYGKVRAMVINSGNSNVCTGKAGLKDAQAMASQAAEMLGTQSQRILVASTGIIGHRLPMTNVRAGITDAAGKLTAGKDSLANQAIMTTDTVEKFACEKFKLGSGEITIGGMVKGAGMIAPSMATMIAVITTDAAITPAAAHKALSAAVGTTFNAVTIDSDTSTSDIVALLAGGAAGNKTITASSASYKTFTAKLTKLCESLARQMASDGEGAHKLVSITVKGARNDAEAEIAAKSVANSPLVKCAVHGADPNWGRIVMAVGKSAATVVQDKLAVKIGGVSVFSRGMGRAFNEKQVSKHLAGKEVLIECNLGLGAGKFTALTCDLSAEYVSINADYHT